MRYKFDIKFLLIFFLYLPLNAYTLKNSKNDLNKAIGGIVGDFICINKNIFSETSLKILTVFSPFYIASRFVDKKLHIKYYDEKRHRNKNQAPFLFKFMAGAGVAVPLGAVALFSLVNPYKETRRVGVVFIESMISSYIVKILIKQVAQTDAGLRPFNADYKKNKVHGGFPSGHMVEMSLMTSLYALRFGPKYAAPLSMVSLLVLMSSINKNRHYLSQVIAGASLGTMYGFAAHKVLKNEKLSKKFQMSIAPNFKGGMTFKVSCLF